jgi:hypothetical protein
MEVMTMIDLVKKWWFWTILVLIVVFFVPKPSGFTGGAFYGPSKEHPYFAKDCTCIGIKYVQHIRVDAGNPQLCSGIPFDCHCFSYWIENNTDVKQLTSCGK